MADPQTNNLGLSVPTRGSDVGTWDLPVNGDFASIDGFLGGVQIVGVTNVNVTLSAPAGTRVPSPGPTQAENAVLRFTGTLTGNVIVTLPLPGYYIIDNQTSGAFVIVFRALAVGKVISVEQGACQHVYNDGTDVRFVNLPPIASYLDVADGAVPAWILACTVPPYLNCDGSNFSAATYPVLNGKLGGNTLPDLRGGSRATLNQGTGRITTAGSGIDGNTRFSRGGGETASLSIVQVPIITPQGNITVILFGGSSQVASMLRTNGIIDAAYGGSGPVSPIYRASDQIVLNTAGSTFSGTPFGGGQNHANMGPTTIFGITLIRAG